MSKCQTCGKQIRDKRNPNKKYCNERCYYQRETGGRPRNRRLATCKVCGKEFEYAASRRPASWCSKACWSMRNPPKFRTCLYCGKEYYSRECANPIYCGKRCYALHKRELVKGENNRFWRGGKTALNQVLRGRAEYGDWRQAVFVRDGFTCQRCGIKSTRSLRVYLHAHHIKPFSKFPALRCEVSNGLTLCKNCHLLEHGHKF